MLVVFIMVCDVFYIMNQLIAGAFHYDLSKGLNILISVCENILLCLFSCFSGRSKSGKSNNLNSSNLPPDASAACKTSSSLELIAILLFCLFLLIVGLLM